MVTYRRLVVAKGKDRIEVSVTRNEEEGRYEFCYAGVGLYISDKLISNTEGLMTNIAGLMEILINGKEE